MHATTCLLLSLLLVSFATGPTVFAQQNSGAVNNNLRPGSISITESIHNIIEISNAAPENETESGKDNDEPLREAERAKPGTSEFWIFLASSIGLTLLAGLMSGLTVGYLSIDELVLELKIKNGTEEERKQVSLS